MRSLDAKSHLKISATMLLLIGNFFVGLADSQAQAWANCPPPVPGQTVQFCSCFGANQGTQDGVGLYAAWQPASESSCQSKSSLTAYNGAINLTAAAIIEGVAANIAAGNAVALPNVSPDPAINNDTGYVYRFLLGTYNVYSASTSAPTVRDNLIKRAAAEIKEVISSIPNYKYSPPSKYCEAPLGLSLGYLNGSVCSSHPYIVYWLDTTNSSVTPNGC